MKLFIFFFVRKEWTNLVEHMKVGTSWWIEGKINADYFEKTNLIVSFEASPTNLQDFM